MMNIRLRLIFMNFLQFFVWGSWLISMGGYMIVSLHFTGGEVAGIYGTMGVASLFMPGLLGILADRYINAEYLYGICHLTGAGLMLWASTIKDYDTLHLVMLLNSMVYMPTIALNNTVSYIVLEKKGLNIVEVFPPIRVWGTVGFVIAMWTVDLLGLTLSAKQLYVSGASAIILGLYAFTMPGCPPIRSAARKSISTALGLDAFSLFRNSKMAVFFLFAMFLGAALQITNAFGVPFLDDFKHSYPTSFAVRHSNMLQSVSQISETLFILTIPFFLKKFGIKRVMMMSIFAWVFRFGLYAVGNPGSGLFLLILSMIIYGMAFDFFNISGSLFIEKEAPISIRASAQGLFMIMTNGLGAWLGSLGSGWVIDHYTVGGVKDWTSIWFVFAGYALVLGIIFPFVFKYKHQPELSPQAIH